MASSDEQLAFPVQISLGSQLAVFLGRNFRLLKYSSWFQVLRIVWFWAHVGFLIGSYLFFSAHNAIITSSVGSFPGDQVHNLSLIWKYYYGNIGIFVLSYVISVLSIRFGKLGIVPYILAFTLVLQIAVFRICIMPILFLSS